MRKEITITEGIERVLRGEQGIRLIISKPIGKDTELGEISSAIECGAVCTMDTDDTVQHRAQPPPKEKSDRPGQGKGTERCRVEK